MDDDEGRGIYNPRPTLKTMTNEQFVVHLMNYAKSGPLIQSFIIDCLEKHSKRVLAADPAIFDNALINGKAWVACAKEVAERVKEKYGD